MSDERQQVIEIYGRLLDDLYPGLRATGTPVEYAQAAAQQVRAAHAARLRELEEARAERDLAKALHDVVAQQRDAREHALLNGVAARAVLAAQDAIALAASARADTQLAALKARLPAFVKKVLEFGATNQYEPTDENVTRLVAEFLGGM